MSYTTVVVMLMMVGSVRPYGTGAPGGACGTMTPNHASYVSSTDPSPYTIKLSKSTYSCGDEIMVTLSGSSFKGFLCQARPVANTYKTIGTLTKMGNTVVMQNKCGSNATLTHTEKSVKNSAMFTWKPTDNDTSSVYFVCTIVQQYATFWVKQKSDMLKFDDSACPGSGSQHVTSSILPIIISVLLGAISVMRNI